MFIKGSGKRKINRGTIAMNAEKMGISNRKAVFQLIRRRPNISRKELAKFTGLDPSTITRIIAFFLEQGFVMESGVNRSEMPGRSSIRLAVVKEAVSSFIVSLGVEKTIIALGFLDHSLKPVEEFPTPASFDIFIEKLISSLKHHYYQNPIKERILGISLSVPGMVDRKRCAVYSLPHLGWVNIDFRQLISEGLPELPIKVFAANEAQLSLMAERYFNSSLGRFQNGVYMFLSQGIGGALLMDGSLYLGNTCSAGEIGHMSILNEGKLCHCGNRGCLETVASVEPIVDFYEEKANRLSGTNYIDKFSELLKLFGEKDPDAVRALYVMQDYFLIGITNLINVLNPEFLMVGGMGHDIPIQWFETLLKRVKEKALSCAVENFRILPSSFDITRSTLLGCELLAMDYFTDNLIR
jgi:predicted NBD/HSP70 family sugar kinase